MKLNLHVGMRKIKSLIAVILTFLVWQTIRLPFPALEIHPVFAYMYAIIEMRENSQKTRSFAKLRIKATIIGLFVGLIFLTIAIRLGISARTNSLYIFAEFSLLLVASFTSLCIADLFDCKDFCGIATIITVICLVSSLGKDPYLYAIMRTLQTLIGVGAATLINEFIANPHKNKNQDA